MIRHHTSRTRGSGAAAIVLLTTTVMGAISAPSSAYSYVECPPDSMFSQPPFDPDGGWTATISDVGDDQLIYENFSVDDDICHFRCWGLMVHWTDEDPPSPCLESPTFLHVRFYDDDNGQPGALRHDYHFTFYPEHTGWEYMVYPTLFPLYVFDFDLSDLQGGCCPQRSGWISVQGNLVTDPDCMFMWMGSAVGDDFCWFENEGEETPMERNYSLCLSPLQIIGDLDGDGDVDTADLLQLLGAWGDCPEPPDGCPGDLDDDGDVDTADLLILLGNWG
ncbi:MAG: hypothetical protein SYC29_13325 [Planctomycetota bacterium]|nr:hypothetical protein [Planctomycetota bacterium]